MKEVVVGWVRKLLQSSINYQRKGDRRVQVRSKLDVLILNIKSELFKNFKLNQ